VLQLSAGTKLHIPVLRALVQAVEDTLKGPSPATLDATAGKNTSSSEEGEGAGGVGGDDDDLAGFVLDIPASLGLLPWAGGSTEAQGEGEEAEAALPYATKSAYQAGVAAAQQRTEEQVRGGLNGGGKSRSPAH